MYQGEFCYKFIECIEQTQIYLNFIVNMWKLSNAYTQHRILTQFSNHTYNMQRYLESPGRQNAVQLTQLTQFIQRCVTALPHICIACHLFYLQTFKKWNKISQSQFMIQSINLGLVQFLTAVKMKPLIVIGISEVNIDEILIKGTINLIQKIKLYYFCGTQVNNLLALCSFLQIC